MSAMRALHLGGLLLALSATLAAEEPAAFHYLIEARDSVLAWDLPATLHTVHGKAPELSGTVDAVPGADGEWSIQARVAVQAAAMVTGNEKRDRNMREKVLETDRFPEIVFEARRVRADLSRLKIGEHFTAEVSGDLTVHGKALPVQFPVDVFVFADHVILQGTFPLPWKPYGLNDPSFGIVTVKDTLRVSFRLKAVEAARKP